MFRILIASAALCFVATTASADSGSAAVSQPLEHSGAASAHASIGVAQGIVVIGSVPVLGMGHALTLSAGALETVGGASVHVGEAGLTPHPHTLPAGEPVYQDPPPSLNKP